MYGFVKQETGRSKSELWVQARGEMDALRDLEEPEDGFTQPSRRDAIYSSIAAAASCASPAAAPRSSATARFRKADAS